MTPVACPWPLTYPSCPLYLFSPFTKQPEIKPLPRAFFPFFNLYFLKHLMLRFVWINERVSAVVCVHRWWRRRMYQWSLKSCVHVYDLCERVRFLLFPVSDHSSRGKVETTVSVCTVMLTEALESGTCEKMLTWWIYQQTPASRWHTYLWMGLFSLSSVL